MPYNSDLYEWTKKYQEKHITPLRAIKIYCKEQCSAGDNKSWKDCTFTACMLYKYRLGKGTRYSMKHKSSDKKHNSTPIKSTKKDMPAGQQELI